MNRYGKRARLCLRAIFLLSVIHYPLSVAVAQDNVTFEVAAPTAVTAGELFRIEFVVNAIKDVEFTPPTIEGFEVMAGPQRSQGTNVEIVNGDFSKTETTTFTYVLQGFTAGVHTISAASVKVRGATHTTSLVSIEVVGDAEQGTGQGNAGTSDGQTSAGQGSGAAFSADDIFILASVNRSEVYKGEPVVVTLKLFSRIQFGYNNDLKLPTFNGFWQQDISPADVNATGKRETLDNRVYNTWTLMEFLLYPQQSGTLTIDPFELSVDVALRNEGNTGRTIFDELMGSADARTVTKKLASGPMKVSVREWPGGAPATFDGAVGDFKLDATPPASAMNANTSGNYTLRISGTGNFPLIRAPKLTLPSSFEEYNVTTSDNTRNTRSGTSGYREFSYPFIPRSDGFYTIPAFEFSYFDPGQRRYVTLSSRETSIEVAADSTAVASGAGLVNGLSREDLKIFGQDIRFIKRGGANLHAKGRMFMWSPLYIAIMAGLVVLFGVGFVVLRGWVRNMQSDRFVRGKRANKVASRRLRTAETSMKQGDKHGFYDEMLKALWGYMSDKLDIPMADLTKERVREELFERNVPEAPADRYTKIISECEEAQYSPSSSVQMNELYKEGAALISELESSIKGGKGRN